MSNTVGIYESHILISCVSLKFSSQFKYMSFMHMSFIHSENSFNEPNPVLPVLFGPLWLSPALFYSNSNCIHSVQIKLFCSSQPKKSLF